MTKIFGGVRKVAAAAAQCPLKIFQWKIVSYFPKMSILPKPSPRLMAASSPIAEAWCCSYYVGGDAEDLDVGDDGGQQPEQVTGKAGLQGGLFQLQVPGGGLEVR